MSTSTTTSTTPGDPVDEQYQQDPRLVAVLEAVTDQFDQEERASENLLVDAIRRQDVTGALRAFASYTVVSARHHRARERAALHFGRT